MPQNLDLEYYNDSSSAETSLSTTTLDQRYGDKMFQVDIRQERGTIKYLGDHLL